MHRLILAALACTLLLTAGCSALQPDRRYALDDTTTFDLKAPDIDQIYRLYVSLPRDYEKRTAERFPVIVLLDAEYSFALPRNFVRLLTDPTIVKIFHFARFDVAVLGKTFGITVAPVYCTKVASKLARTNTELKTNAMTLSQMTSSPNTDRIESAGELRVTRSRNNKTIEVK